MNHTLTTLPTLWCSGKDTSYVNMPKFSGFNNFRDWKIQIHRLRWCKCEKSIVQCVYMQQALFRMAAFWHAQSFNFPQTNEEEKWYFCLCSQQSYKSGSGWIFISAFSLRSEWTCLRFSELLFSSCCTEISSGLSNTLFLHFRRKEWEEINILQSFELPPRLVLPPPLLIPHRPEASRWKSEVKTGGRVGTQRVHRSAEEVKPLHDLTVTHCDVSRCCTVQPGQPCWKCMMVQDAGKQSSS